MSVLDSLQLPVELMAPELVPTYSLLGVSFFLLFTAFNSCKPRSRISIRYFILLSKQLPELNNHLQGGDYARIEFGHSE